ncbi:hypothetical protein SLA2020_108430 [Shorea laevis]
MQVLITKECKQTFKIFCWVGLDFVLTIRDGKAVLAPSNILDEKQHWYKINKISKKDGENFPAFVLVNKATAQSLRNAVECGESVQLSSKDPNVKDTYLLWKGSVLENGFRAIRSANKAWLYLDAFDGALYLDPFSERFVQDGTNVVVCKGNKSDTQCWKILPYSAPFKIYCKCAPNFYLTIRNGKAILAPANPFDKFQRGYKDRKYSNRVKDADGLASFALANQATGLAIKHSAAAYQHVQLVSYNPTVLDESVLWTQRKHLDGDYKTIRMVNNPRLVWHAADDDVHDGTNLINHPWNEEDNQQWIIEPYCEFLENAR